MNKNEKVKLQSRELKNRKLEKAEAGKKMRTENLKKMRWTKMKK